ncbi:DNA polymerase III subunit [Peptostreptococcus sp. D1]|uniref:DNA polymerase III subunit n=1 Tax=Peptostreptococcus sp. D1 TaxID=72304 RepID=UPI0008DFAFD2|nr:AAA family ATPase [Peptostreptococcus sp. D1]SFE56254.1 DNA polymerase-3 subunit delta' [Peptostreptococcus sp. D1]
MFENIIGHKREKNMLEHIIKSNNVSNAYIFSGPEGIGKRMMANAFASRLFGVSVDNSPDFELIQPEKSENSIKIDKIRGINSSINLNPISDYRIYLINDAEKMTLQAQNALLKTLEEPSSYGIIILVTKNEQALLETIRSRCLDIKFSPLSISEVHGYLISRKMEEEISKASSILSRGSIKRALETSQNEEIIEIRNIVKNILSNAIDRRDIFELSRTSEYLKGYSSQIAFFIEFIKLYMRDMIVFGETKNFDLIINKEDKEFVNRLSSKISLSKLGKLMDVVIATEKKINANCNFNTTMNSMADSFYKVVN